WRRVVKGRGPGVLLPRGLRLATQFLTRVPVPAVDDFSTDELSRSAAWFPFVGSVLGALVAAVVFVCSHRSVSLGAVLGLIAWVWLTGALHLDGLADLSDALAAAHRDPLGGSKTKGTGVERETKVR